MVRGRVRALAATPGRLLVVSDFDGTLSPIVPDPTGARIEPGGRSALRRLARVAEARPERLALAVLSGRAAADVARRVRVGGIRYLGNHGLESGTLSRGEPAERLEVRPHPSAGPSTAARARTVGAAVAALLGHPGWLFVEDKGPSVAFHFRQAEDPAAARSIVLDALDRAEEDGEGRGEQLERLEGRQVVELRPSGSGGKGAAMERLLVSERPDAVLVLGDDVSDADAFRVVNAASAASGGKRRPPAIRGLVIAVHGAAETPMEVVEAADLLVAAPRDAARALGELARVLSAEPGGPEGAPR